MSKFQRLIEDMMVAIGQEVPNHPVIPTKEVLDLRIALIKEEVDKELIPALEALRDGERNKFEETVDGIVDSLVVLVGTLSAMGIRDKPLLMEVARNNLAKFVDPETGEKRPIRRDALGKGLKPIGHIPPDIEGCIRDQLFPGRIMLQVIACVEITYNGPGTYYFGKFKSHWALNVVDWGDSVEIKIEKHISSEDVAKLCCKLWAKYISSKSIPYMGISEQI